MPGLITALTTSAIKKDCEKKTNNKVSKIKNFTTKTQYLNLRATSDTLKKQSDKTLTTQIYFF